MESLYQNRHLLGVPDACRALSISKTTLFRIIAAKKIRPVKILGRTLIPQAEIERVAAEGIR